MTQTKDLERLGVSSSIARKDPLEGNGEVDGHDRRIATWGDFASKFWEEHPEWDIDQVYAFLGLTNKPYDYRPQTDVFGSFKPDYDQRTIHNPNPFNLAELRYQETRRFEKEMAPNFEAEKERLCGLVDQLVMEFQESDWGGTDDSGIVQEIASLQDEYSSRSTELSSRNTLSYDDVWFLPHSDPKMKQYRLESNAYTLALDELRNVENQILLAERKLQSMQDFGIAVNLSELVREMLVAEIDQGTGWNMRVTWDGALNRLVDSISDESDVSPESKVGEVFITLNDVDRLKELIKDSNHELRKYGEACWEIIEPITKVSPIEEHSLVTGVGVK